MNENWNIKLHLSNQQALMNIDQSTWADIRDGIRMPILIQLT